MTDKEKAVEYDKCLREGDRIQRKISELKSEYGNNPPNNIQQELKECANRMRVLERKVDNLF